MLGLPTHGQDGDEVMLNMVVDSLSTDQETIKIHKEKSNSPASSTRDGSKICKREDK